MVTQQASVRRSGPVSSKTPQDLVRKTRQPIRTCLVRPGVWVGVLVHSQDRTAKTKDAKHKIGGVGIGGWGHAAGVAGQERKELLQWLGSNGFLAVGRRVSIGERF
jgi:hypothetical protein